MMTAPDLRKSSISGSSAGLPAASVRLVAQANIMTMEEARGIHPNTLHGGRTKTGTRSCASLNKILPTRQPGYGTSYITGNSLIDQSMGSIRPAKRSSRRTV
ncbi:MAG: hypothetical protein IPP04_03000 [Saprospiraceae bacterium]|nr:hypothetical protein [Saprospiraceae bacterium]